jgi:hypothetical protein
MRTIETTTTSPRRARRVIGGVAAVALSLGALAACGDDDATTDDGVTTGGVTDDGFTDDGGTDDGLTDDGTDRRRLRRRHRGRRPARRRLGDDDTTG